MFSVEVGCIARSDSYDICPSSSRRVRGLNFAPAFMICGTLSLTGSITIVYVPNRFDANTSIRATNRLILNASNSTKSTPDLRPVTMLLMDLFIISFLFLAFSVTRNTRFAHSRLYTTVHKAKVTSMANSSHSSRQTALLRP